MILPLSTYRLQMNGQFTFLKAQGIVDYLHELGVSHIYSSPLLAAHSHSIHGYDVVDYSLLNSEIGSDGELETLVALLRERGMGIILDIVPNHMFIVGSENSWWMNVLENGPSSPYADYFDIEWHSLNGGLENQVLLPLLDQQYGNALEDQALQVIFEKGAFFVTVATLSLPTDPSSWILLLTPIEEELKVRGDEDAVYQEYASIMTALKHLPSSSTTDESEVKERQREKELIKNRLDKLVTENLFLQERIQQRLQQLNGVRGDPRSLDGLEEFLSAQPYRLCYWRVASDEINYRRFFDISDLAGIKTERDEVFDHVHSKVLELVKKGLIDGLRIDHIDGLIDPEGYLLRLRNFVGDALYIVAEKILTGREELRSQWPLAGTVGYDFINLVTGLLVAASHKEKFYSIYRNFTGITSKVSEVIYGSKALTLQISMSSEHYVLSRVLNRIAKQHRSSRDFTAESLRGALRDVIASFPVYRSYIRPWVDGAIHDEDRSYIQKAIAKAKRLNPLVESSIFDFIKGVLLLEYPPGLTDDEVLERHNFVARFQQLTGPIAAKGIEDTAFYRFYPLASLNEVGGDMLTFGVSIADFHSQNQKRREQWPYTMAASSTHDTKRSEDVRARICVLSEIPEAWQRAIQYWSRQNNDNKVMSDEDLFPDANDEYLLYQTIVGTWPLIAMDEAAHKSYVDRIVSYMEKASREAKIYSGWIHPNAVYDNAKSSFIQKILMVSSSFMESFLTIIPRIQVAGIFNSLSQTLLKLTSPGVPDIYQGCELWDFSLVDPDNRRSVDFDVRKRLLGGLVGCKVNGELIDELMDNSADGRIKLFTIWQTLQLRLRYQELFLEGSYRPLEVTGCHSDRVVAFARSYKERTIVVIAARWFMEIMGLETPYLSEAIWEETGVIVPDDMPKCYHSVFYGDTIDTTGNLLPLGKLLKRLPIALLLNNR